MRALSLWQPWGSAVAVGAKRFETRHWSVNIRERIAIHAARTTSALQREEWTRGVLWASVLGVFGDSRRRPGWLARAVPLGAVVAIADLVDCIPVEHLTADDLDQPRGGLPRPFTERELGDFTPGRFGWLLDDVVRLEKPVLCRGQQGLFDLSGPTEKQVLLQLQRQKEGSQGP